MNNDSYSGNLALCRDSPISATANPCDPNEPANFVAYEDDADCEGKDYTSQRHYARSNGTYSRGTDPTAALYVSIAVIPGRKTYDRKQVDVSYTGVSIDVKDEGGVYVLFVDGPKSQPTSRLFQVVPSNRVSILWLIPQIVVITVGEILFSVTGYEFTYTQAAPSMKALVQAIWLLTTAMGDAIIVLIAALNPFSDLAVQSFAYAGLMLGVIFVFALLAHYHYEYKYYG
ncbi:CRE-PEPT-1 protein [Aphelenchoides avenae]|nr:CRE-PEPT-1 protein [Aphelenchus avenae]